MEEEKPKKRMYLKDLLEQWEKKRKEPGPMERPVTYEELERAFRRNGRASHSDSYRSSLLPW